MPLTFEEFCRFIADGLFESWLEESGLTVDDLRTIYRGGAAPEYVEAFEAISRGKVTADHLPRVLPRLQHGTNERTIRTMDVNTQGKSSAVKRAVGRATRKHAAQVTLYEKGVTITALAKELRETRERVSSWFADGGANRAVPERHVEYMRKKYGIPRSAWARIAS